MENFTDIADQVEMRFPIYNPGSEPDWWDEQAAIFLDFVIRNGRIDVRSFTGLDNLHKLLEGDPLSDSYWVTEYQKHAGLPDAEVEGIKATAHKKVRLVWTLVRFDDLRKDREDRLSQTTSGRELLAFVDGVRRTMSESESGGSETPMLKDRIQKELERTARPLWWLRVCAVCGFVMGAMNVWHHAHPLVFWTISAAAWLGIAILVSIPWFKVRLARFFVLEALRKHAATTAEVE